MRFVKRRLGNNMMRPVTGLLGLMFIYLLIVYPCFAMVFLTIPTILYGLTQNFGKEMVEVDFENQSISTYFQLIFDFPKTQQKFKTIEYILVRDFGTNQNHTILGSDSGFYEVSIVRAKGSKIVLAYRESSYGIRSLMMEIEANCSYPIKDGTKSKVLSRNSFE